jgi:DNA primase large subunit
LKGRGVDHLIGLRGKRDEYSTDDCRCNEQHGQKQDTTSEKDGCKKNGPPADLNDRADADKP